MRGAARQRRSEEQEPDRAPLSPPADTDAATSDDLSVSAEAEAEAEADNRRLAAADPATPAARLKALAKDPDLGVRVALAANSSCPRAALRRLASNSRREPSVLRALAKNTNAGGLMLDGIARRRWDVACAVATNPACPRWLLRSSRLRGSRYQAVRMSVAARMPRPAEHFSKLIRNDPVVRLYLATNPAIDGDQVAKLLADRDRYVRRVAAAHPAAPPAGLARLAEGMTEPAWTLRALAANPACPPDVADQVLTWLALGGAGSADPRFDPVACTGHPADPGLNLVAWYRGEAANVAYPFRHPLWRIRAATPSSRTSTPYSWLAVMARDLRSEVRLIASRYPGLPVSLLRELTGDGASSVAATAAASLERKLASPGFRTQRRKRRISLASVAALVAVLLFGAIHGGDGPTVTSQTLPDLSGLLGPSSGSALLNPGGVPQLTGPDATGDTPLPGGGDVQIAADGPPSGGTLVFVTTGTAPVTVAIPASVASLPPAAAGYQVAAEKVVTFVLTTSTPQRITVTVTSPNAAPVQVTADVAPGTTK